MSFASRVLAASHGAYDKQFRAASEFAVNAFKAACLERAELGLFSAEATPLVRGFFSDELLQAMDVATFHRLLKQIEREVLALGFRTVRVEPFDNGALKPRDRDYMRLKINCGWSAGTGPVVGKLGSNVRCGCPVCLEHKECVALSPCGHLICIECSASIIDAKQACPTCRAKVASAHSVFSSS